MYTSTLLAFALAATFAAATPIPKDLAFDRHPPAAGTAHFEEPDKAKPACQSLTCVPANDVPTNVEKQEHYVDLRKFTDTKFTNRRVAVASPKKKGGKKARRDLDSVLEELD